LQGSDAGKDFKINKGSSSYWCLTTSLARLARPPHTRPTMCRNIKTLFNFEPPATELEIRDASLQFVRKLSGFSVPSRANEAAFNQAVEEVAATARRLMASLVTHAEPRNREAEAFKAKARSAKRFGTEAEPSS
jgi:hypothetical protein